jgi:hypothetical protein
MNEVLHEDLEQLQLLGGQVFLVHLGVGDEQVGRVRVQNDIVDRPAAATVARTGIAEPNRTFRIPPEPGMTSPALGSAAIMFSMAAMSPSEAPSFFRRFTPAW